MVITLLSGGSPEDWVAEFGSTHPVLADTSNIAGRWERDGYIPSDHLLAPGLVVTIIDGDVGAEQIEDLLP